MIYLYRLINQVTGKWYIGVSRSVVERCQEHARSHKHKTQCTMYIARAIAKYGWENFLVDILAYDEPEIIYALEIKYIKKFNTLKPIGYNLSTGGESGALGAEKSLTHRQNLSKALTGKRRSEETRKKISAANKLRRDNGFQTPCSIPVIYNGIEYKSIAEASRVLNIPYINLYYYIRRNQQKIGPRKSSTRRRLENCGVS